MTEQQAVEPYPYTVYTTATEEWRWLTVIELWCWSCNCGAAGVFVDERKCRDAGFAHQQAHQRAFEAERRLRGGTCRG